MMGIIAWKEGFEKESRGSGRICIYRNNKEVFSGMMGEIMKEGRRKLSLIFFSIKPIVVFLTQFISFFQPL
ncbi:MAG: hypothetical protein J6J00_10680 [Treponema sp.]|nr:hypothetical protein [Treponema sp.]